MLNDTPQSLPQAPIASPQPIETQQQHTSSQQNSQRAAATLPPGIAGWSWGAFLLNGLWAAGNKTWIGLLAFVPFLGLIMAVVLGVKGREWAWKNNQWDSAEHFNRVQKRWSLWGGVIAAIIFISTIVILTAIDQGDLFSEHYNDNISEKIDNYIEGFAQDQTKPTSTGLSNNTNTVIRHGSLSRFSTSGDMRFKYYDADNKITLDNYNGYPWFSATIQNYTNPEELDKFVEFISTKEENSIFKLTGIKEKDDCGSTFDGTCVESILITDIQIMPK